MASGSSPRGFRVVSNGNRGDQQQRAEEGSQEQRGEQVAPEPEPEIPPEGGDDQGAENIREDHDRHRSLLANAGSTLGRGRRLMRPRLAEMRLELRLALFEIEVEERAARFEVLQEDPPHRVGYAVGERRTGDQGDDGADHGNGREEPPAGVVREASGADAARERGNDGLPA